MKRFLLWAVILLLAAAAGFAFAALTYRPPDPKFERESPAGSAPLPGRLRFDRDALDHDVLEGAV